MAAARCSFCRMTEERGAKLIFGPDACICQACVVSMMGIIETETSRGSEGQILVQFPDGGATLCEQRHAWRGFQRDGVDFDWCAVWTKRAGERLGAVAVRPGSEKQPIFGSTLPAGEEPSEEEARRVIDARGSTLRRTPVFLKFIGKGTFKEKDQSWSRTLTRLSFVGGPEVTSFLSQQHGVPTINLAEYTIAAEITKLVPKELCLRLRLIPVSRAAQSLVIAMADPGDRAAMDEVGRMTGYRVEPLIASQAQIEDAITKYFGRP